jgi:ABC-type multidrug transport system permease subunit
MNIFLKNKTKEQKVVMVMTIIASLFGVIIMSNDLFVDIRFMSYILLNILIATLQFLLLQLFFNKKRIKTNLMVSIPLIGFVNACILFLKNLKT